MIARLLSLKSTKYSAKALLGVPVIIGSGLFVVTPAGAQAVCVDTPANATCGPGNYPAGISYDVDGDFTIRVESGAVIGRSDVTSDQDGVHLDGDAPGHLQVILENGVSISTLPEGGDGVQVHATSAGGSVEIVSGANITISTNIDGDPAEFDNSGLLGWVDAGEGYIAITQNAGSSITVTGVGSGIWGYHVGSGNVTLVSGGTIEGSGGDVWGILGTSNGGDVAITQEVTGRIVTDGSGIVAETNGSGSIGIITFGEIETSNDSASGINAENVGTGQTTVAHHGSILTSGTQAHGISISASTGAAAVDISTAASVTVTGSEAIGVFADTGSKLAIGIDGTVGSTGNYGVGVSATSAATALVDVADGATVTGGWQSDLSPGGAGYSAAGIIMDSTASLLRNSGSIGAGSDRAIFSAGALAATNSGRITGFLASDGSGATTFTNEAGALFDVRHFADTDGDGVRDTKRVAVSDLGGGDFDNLADAIVRLAPVTGQTSVDNTGYYVPTTGATSVPLEASFYDLTRAGVAQGQFLGTATFTNSGILDLRGPAIGNTLLITGDATASGGPYAGTFVSNGGTLRINTVFNEGIPIGGATGSYSDVLIVDNTILGTAATLIDIDRRDGVGAETPGNGILVVDVRGTSEAGAFTLAGDYIEGGSQRVVGGAYAYELTHNGIGADAADGNWYLRSAAVAPTVPVYEEYPKVLVPLAELPTYRRRVGNRFWQNVPSCDDADPGDLAVVREELDRCFREESARPLMDQGGIWGRIEGAHGQYQAADSTSGAHYDSNILLFQVGLESQLVETSQGELFGALTAQYGHAGAHVSASGGDGKIRSNGYGIGGTLTWLAKSGLYVDAQGQITFLDSDIVSTTAGNREILSGHKGIGYALGLEIGHRYEITHDWTLIPQAQLIYTRITLDDATDVFGATISLIDGDSLRGRVGLAAEHQKSWAAEDGTTSRLATHGTVNLYNEFLDGARIRVGNLERASRHERLWGGVNLGATYNWNDDRYALYADASAETSLRNFGDSYALSGSVGFKVRW